MTLVTAKLVRDRMDAAREGVAKELLAWEEVAKAIGEAAGKGHSLTLFGPPVGVSIKETTTATELVEKLRATGFRCAWRERRDPGDVLTHALEVSWDAPGAGG
jgi:hypothetical protein